MSPGIPEEKSKCLLAITLLSIDSWGFFCYDKVYLISFYYPLERKLRNHYVERV
jgi:hypothetical protein